MLYKPQQNGIFGSILDWIWDYLSDHEQNILLEGYSSTKQNTNAGVPQGSAFGLFSDFDIYQWYNC